MPKEIKMGQADMGSPRKSATKGSREKNLPIKQTSKIKVRKEKGSEQLAYKVRECAKGGLLVMKKWTHNW